jgi:uncharacterized protein (DUF305 family)
MKQPATALIAVAALALTFALAGCGEGTQPAVSPPSAAEPSISGTPAAASSAGYTAEDVMFLQMLVSQEKETADLIAMLKGRSVSASTRNLTAAIRATQADEADEMVAWLRARKQPATADPNPALHTHHGGLTALTAADLAGLRQARGHDFERQVLNILVGQQHNAIELARTAAGAGGDPWVATLAQRVDRSRTAEVAEMLTLVAAVPTT